MRKDHVYIFSGLKIEERTVSAEQSKGTPKCRPKCAKQLLTTSMLTVCDVFGQQRILILSDAQLRGPRQLKHLRVYP